MNNVETVKENIEVGVKSITKDICIQAKLHSTEDTTFDLLCSIDELGQIVLTPVHVSVQFDSAYLLTDETEQKENKYTDDILTILDTTICLQANLLAEVDNTDLTIVIDEIGQCVIAPVVTENIFISAAIQDSLNLVTEEAEEPTDASSEETTIPEVEATVIEENFQENELLSDLAQVTSNFTDEFGIIQCETLDDAAYCYDILKQHYNKVSQKAHVIRYEGRI